MTLRKVLGSFPTKDCSTRTGPAPSRGSFHTLAAKGKTDKMDSEILNAVITSVSISIEDHGCLTAWVNLDMGGSGVGFGGFALDAAPDSRTAESKRKYAPACSHFICRVLEVVGAGTWEDLKGMSCRVQLKDQRAYAIGNLLRDKWFNPSREFEVYKNSRGAA